MSRWIAFRRFGFSKAVTAAGAGKRLRSAAALFAVFLIVLGARLWLIERAGSQVPILDQWDAEGAFLLKPFVEGSLHAKDLVAAHNEHRPLLTRLFVLLLFALNGQWDPFLEIVANAILFAGVVVFFAYATSRLTWHRISATAAVVLWAALPFGFENTVWGFQSQFYFLIFFSLVALWALLTSSGNTIVAATGALAATVSFFTMASGFLCAVPVLLIALLRWVTRRSPKREAAVLLSVALVVIIAGWLLRAPPVPHHAAFTAPSIGSWLTLFARCLAWPFCSVGWMAAIIYLPIVVLGILYLRRDRRLGETTDTRVELLLGTSFWVILQAAAISYGRAGYEAPVQSRYMDLLAIGTLTNFFALLLLLAHRSTRAGRVVAAGWVVIVVIGALLTSSAELRYEKGRRDYMDNAISAARTFLATHDIEVLKAPATMPIPYPDPGRIASLLEDSTIQHILPSSLRPALRLEPATSDAAFALNGLPYDVPNTLGERVWGSYTLRGTRATGVFTSKRIKTVLRYLEFDIAGYLRPGLSLEVTDTPTGNPHRAIPIKPIANQWRAAYIAVPRGEHTILATDTREDQWFGFREPRECGSLSFYAFHIARWGIWLFASGLLLFVVWGLESRLSQAATMQRCSSNNPTK